MKITKEKLTTKVNDHVAWSIVAIMTLFTIIWALTCSISSKKHNTIEAGDVSIETTTLNPEAPAVATNTNTNEAVSESSTNPNRLSYEKALKEYNGRRIQIGQDCQTTPNNMTFKNEVYIMVDNRSSKARSFVLGEYHTVGAWQYKIVYLSSNSLPRQFLMDCDNSQNVATVLLQK